ncbi:MAG: alanine--tRNA ligase [Deltaproteobacteria bacterium]|nr:alanine--tRNA ligase [Deltaproteobacteria bacterium]MBW1965805.1 alanine--tRNA ligase [Deltaproteobacteria bacterium]MBW2097274.1 alanine--tRNA ligase [Deltaproteobacteria bacterium]
MSGKQIRSLFLDFFSRNGSEIIPSSPLIPAEDPSLLFTNSGMVQFKKVFLGEETRSYTRAASCQKCVRAGGKHNDLENVGYTARHHTFFEMLGNFSFGDYFKREAISFAWDFLTKEIELPVEDLWVTVFREDDEAAKFWPEITGISPDRVVRLGEEDNFWAMGDTGPCGPCSEILVDQGPDVGCGRPDCKVGCDCDRFLELWNLVFMQFFRDESGRMTPLPTPCIDTGLGLERMAAICQGRQSNYDTDIFAGLIACIEELSGRTYGKDRQSDVAIKVIADHTRASTFLIADGLIPSNEGRGYVLRRIIRRAVRYGKVIGLKGPFISSVADVVVREMGETYPELKKASAFLGKVIDHEESRFAETLEFGLRFLDEEIAKLKKEHKTQISGNFAFKLHDTYGLPVDILLDVAREEDMGLDRDGYERARSEQRERSRKARHDTVTEELPQVYRELLSSNLGNRFIGYDTTSHKSEILALLKQGRPIQRAPAGWCGELIAAETPFYAESGGQVGDRGWVEGPSGRAEVTDTFRKGDLIVHSIEVKHGYLESGDSIKLEVSENLRKDTARNHTATHLLHSALRQVLGEHVKQAGSMVAPDRLRFDFTHFSALTPDEIREVEDLVNEQIREDREVKTEILSYKEAMARDAMALFGEKYGETVRLVSVPDFSKELCGGTHVSRTGQIGLFKIISESSVASGMRRLEACTAQTALDFVHELEEAVSSITFQLKCPRREASKKVTRLLEMTKDLEKQLQQVKKARATQGLDKLLSGTREINHIKVLSARVEAENVRSLRDLGDRLRDKIGSGVIVIGSRADGKALLLVLVTKDLTDRLHAGNMIKQVARIIGGSGGGRPEMAQAGGPKPERLEEALEAVYDIVHTKLVQCKT